MLYPVKMRPAFKSYLWGGTRLRDLYGKDATVLLLGFIRGEKKFDSLQELKAQVQKDFATAFLINQRD